MNRINSLGALPLALLLPLAGCLGQASPGEEPPKAQGPGIDAGAPPAAAFDLAIPPKEDPLLAGRQIDYGLALRTAALKLTGELPTMEQIQILQRADDPRRAYEALIDGMLADRRFVPQLVAFFRDAFKMGGKVGDLPTFETAPTFAARLVVEGRPITELFTATTKTCPTWSADKGFEGGDCKNGLPQQAGVITDPGVQAQYYSNMAFRRVRWLQETFDCRKFPAEYGKAPVQMGNGLYSSPWPFKSIAGGDSAAVDFHDTKSVVCANCHATMNHLAPLFANFDAKGQWQMTSQVLTPIEDLPKTKLADWLPPGETTAWRFGVEVSTLNALGEAMARDPGVHGCFATRVYDWAMSKDDPVVDLATVPEALIAPYREELVQGRFDLKRVIRKAFTADDFVKF